MPLPLCYRTSSVTFTVPATVIITVSIYRYRRPYADDHRYFSRTITSTVTVTDIVTVTVSVNVTVTIPDSVTITLPYHSRYLHSSRRRSHYRLLLPLPLTLPLQSPLSLKLPSQLPLAVSPPLPLPSPPSPFTIIVAVHVAVPSYLPFPLSIPSTSPL